MSSRTSFADLSEKTFLRRSKAFQLSGLRLVLIASALHVFLAVTLFAVGRAQIAPTLVDRDGIMDSFAHDSYEYQRGAVQLAELLRSGRIKKWVTAAQPIHVKLLAIPFSLLAPIFGYGVLSAEPYNVICYATVVGLVFAFGCEVYSRRAGLLAGAAVALCPTFLLHTTQLLKDSLFIAGLLAFLLCVTTALTRTYRPRFSAGVTLITMLMLLLLFFVRSNVVIVILGVGLLSLALLMMRQYFQRRFLLWNMVSTLAVALTALLLISFSSGHTTAKLKQFPSEQSGQPKMVAGVSEGIQTRVVVVAATNWNTGTFAGRCGAAADKLARRVGSMRSRFAASYPDSGSQLDGTKEFRSLNDLLGYLPRALEIGLWAPFPNTWVLAGRRIGGAGRLLAAGEMFLIYLFQLMAVMAVAREPRRAALWFLLAISVLGVTGLALIVPNVGALYRFRYTFWILLVIVAMSRVDQVLAFQGNKVTSRFSGLARAIVFACALVMITSCSSFQRPNSRHLPEKVTARPDFSLTNFTGASVRGIYLSPHTSGGWEENILGETELKDGDSVKIGFNPNEKAIVWDMRVEGVDGHYAEWKELTLGEISEMTLLFKLMPQPVVIAEVE